MMASFVQARIKKHMRAKMRKDVPTPRTAGTRVGGSTKFVESPEGAAPAGSVCNKEGGICLID